MVIVRFLVITKSILGILIRHKRIKNTPEDRKKFSKYLRHRLEKLGPTFIKIGQILSLRPDLVPLEFCLELRNLLDKTPEIPVNEVMEIIKEELGSQPSKVFSEISRTPLGSASIAQVHKAKLKSTGEFVAIKVRKPGVKNQFKADIKVLKLVVFLFGKKIDRVINSKYVINELEGVFDKETNFTTEGTNIERFKESFKNLKFVTTPKVYWDYTTERIIVLEFIPGVGLNAVFNKLDKESKLKDQPTFTMNGLLIDKKRIAKRIIHVTSQSVFDEGFFHADPHPANMILTYDDKIAYIDFGMVGDLMSDEKVLFRELMYYITLKDEGKLTDLLVNYNKSVGIEPPEKATLASIKHYLHEIVGEFASADQQTFPTTNLMYALGGLSFKFHFPPPPFIMLIAKQIFTLEGLALYLMPNMNVIDEFKPYVISYRTKDSLKNLSNAKLFKFVDEAINLGVSLPESINSIVNKIKEEGLQPIPKITTNNYRPLFFIISVYLLIMGVFCLYIVSQTQLLFIIWSSIITAILTLYFILYKYHNGQ